MNANIVKYAAINENELTNDTCATIERRFRCIETMPPVKTLPK